jgi:hypothetical protein
MYRSFSVSRLKTFRPMERPVGLNPAGLSLNQPVSAFRADTRYHAFAGKTGEFQVAVFPLCKQEVAGSIPAGSIGKYLQIGYFLEMRQPQIGTR